MSPMYHRLEVYVLDFEKYGVDDIITNLDRMDCFYFKVADHQTTVIPEWTDAHELNKSKCTLETRRKYFDVSQVGKYVDVPLRESTDLKMKLERIRNNIAMELKDG
jgi:hypothetical protein